MSDDQNLLTIETVTKWARTGHEWDKVFRYIFLHPEHFFYILSPRKWSIAHQVIYHGDVDLFKRFLSLFSNDQINIRSLSKDNKTLLHVAEERKSDYPAMYTYVEHLFAQDELIQAAKKSNWRLVTELLDKNKLLANEKPPYSNYFLLHYIVKNGDYRILEDLYRRFQFQTNVLSADNETPLAIAERLNKRDMYDLLAPSTQERTRSMPLETRSATVPRRDEQIFTFSSMPVASQQSTASSSASLPLLGFGNILLALSPSGNFTVEQQQDLFNSSKTAPSQPPPQKQASKTMAPELPHLDTKKSIVKQSSSPTPPPPSVSSPPLLEPQQTAPPSEQVIRNMTCMLTQRIFVDPVIASDGQTYERAAIIDWIKLFHCSPATGAPMDAKFKDNTELKQLIESMQPQT